MKVKRERIPTAPVDPQWGHHFETLAERLRKRLPPGAPIYLVSGQTPEELWRSLEGTGLPRTLLLEIWKRGLAKGYNLLAFSPGEGHLHLEGSRVEL